MENKEIKLAVNKLRISFRTANGKVQAVRGIDFNLYKGETLAIVGESGSGKSVTTRAILGILANNAIKEGGEIIYDGQDLTKINEEDFHKIRGDKIAMIFQDPLSSLNPIMRIGKQMTEAMIIKGKINQSRSRKDFNGMLSKINYFMDLALEADKNISVKEENKKLCKDFDTFEYKHLELEGEYNKAHEAGEDTVSEIDDILFRIEKKSFKDIERDVKEAMKRAPQSVSRYVVHARADELKNALSEAGAELLKCRKVKKENRDYSSLAAPLSKVREIIVDALSLEKPNFFAMGYYMTFCNEPVPETEIGELNAFLRKEMDEKFMFHFIDLAQKGVATSFVQSQENTKAAIEIIEKNIPAFASFDADRKTLNSIADETIVAVEKAINQLDVVKDNILYTFGTSLKAAIALYFDGIERNKAEEKRYAKQLAAYNKIVEKKGKEPEWKLIDKNLVALDDAKADVLSIMDRVKTHLQNNLKSSASVSFKEKTVALIDYLKEKASGVVYKVTKEMAKERALKLLEEVGIPDPRRRFRQYPFEFSGGMRQRIVIAIALSANPDVLICDEPTTALDVTIQSQILELINKIKRERGISVIFITHDLGVVANMADRVAVMYAGKVVEIGTTDDVFYSPAHPYTWALLSSMPDLDTKEKLEAIPGTPPNMIYPPKGDAFAARNKYAMQIDFEEQPPMFKITDTHYAATWLLHPDAPKVEPPKIVTDRIERMKKTEESNNG